MARRCRTLFGDKRHISIERCFGFIQVSTATSACTANGRRLKRVVRQDSTPSDVWADSAECPINVEGICEAVR